MVTSIVLTALIGTLQFNSAISAAINYEPIKITVNENFNAQPGQVSPELQEPGVLHQGANFYFKPQLNLPSSYIPSHIEGLISLIQQHHHSCAKDNSKVVLEKDKLIEVLKPFMYPLSDISKETLSNMVLEKENNSILAELTGVFPTIPEIAVRPISEPIINYIEPKPTIHELETNPEGPVLPSFSLHDISSIIEEEVKKKESIILEEPTGVFPTIPEIAVRPIEEPIINYIEPKPITSELVVIPEAPVLPSLSHQDISSIIEEVENKKSITLEEPTDVFPTIPEIDVRPIEEPIFNYIEPKPITSELVVIPEAPVLPSLSHQDISSIIEEEVENKKSITLEEPTDVFPTIPEIDVRPIEEPIFNYVEPRPIPSELVLIPEAPVLPPLTLNGFPSIIEEEVENKKSITLEEPTGVFPTIPEIDVRPIEEPIFNYVEPRPISSELVLIPEAPVLPPLTLNGFPSVIEEEVKNEESIILEESTGVFPTITKIAAGPITEPIFSYGEPKSTVSGLVVIPEAPVLPSLSLQDISSIIEEEVKNKKSVTLEEPTDVFPIIPEIDVRPIEEPIFNYVEPRPIPSELVLIPEAPVLPPLTLNGFPSVTEEEVKNEESIILEESTGVIPTITKIASVPITEPIINYGEPKPAISGLVIPEAPVLPLFSLHDISSIVEEVENKKSITLEEPTGVFPTIPEIDVRPIEEPIFNYVEPRPIPSELVLIPEAPVLPPLTLNGFPSIIEEEVENKKSITLEEPTGVFPIIPEIDVRPIEEPIFNYVEPRPIPSELVLIPEAPVLPPLTLNGFPSVVEEEVKNEESIILEESTGVFPTITKIAAGPITEPIFSYGEPKSTVSGLVVIPEAPVLPSLSLQDISSIIEEEVKNKKSITLEEPTDVFPTIPEIDVRPIEEPIFNYVEPRPIPSELVLIPEAPVLPPLTLNGFPSVVEEEVKKEESIILEEPTGVFPTIPEIAMRPIEEPSINYVDPKPITSELVLIPEAPVLPPLALNGFPSVVEEEVKNEESIILEESPGVFPTITEIAATPITEPSINYGEPKPTTSGLVVIPEAPVLPALSFNDIHVVEEDVKIEEPIIVDIEPKPITSELVVIPEAPVLSPLSYNGISPIVEEVKIEESINVEQSTGDFLSIPKISGRPFPEPLENKKLTETTDSFALENNIFPVVTEEVKIEIPILLEESIKVFPPIAEISSGRTLQEFSPEITDSYVLEEVSQPNPENVVTVKETLPPTIIPKPSNHLGVFSYVPFVSHLSYNGAPKTKKLMVPKPASLERFLLKKHQLRLPVTPFPKLDLNAIKSCLGGNKKQFLYPTSYAHDVVEKRIAPNMAFKKQNGPKRVKIYIRSNVPKGPR